jgi:hypothetical protein
MRFASVVVHNEFAVAAINACAMIVPGWVVSNAMMTKSECARNDFKFCKNCEMSTCLGGICNCDGTGGSEEDGEGGSDQDKE